MKLSNSSLRAGNNDSDEIAKAQWKCIEELERQFKGRKVRGTDNSFEDEEWRDKLKGDGIIWSSVTEDNSQALLLLLKIGVYHQIDAKATKIRTMIGYLSYFKLLLGEVLKSKELLIGRKNELLRGFNQISTEDVLHAIDNVIIRGHSINSIPSTLNIVKEISSSILDGVPFLKASYEFPWKANSFHQWVKKRRAELGAELPKVNPYLAMPQGTTQPIIEHSMNIIERYAELILEIHNQAKSYHESHYTEFFHSVEGDAYLTINAKKLEQLSPVVLCDYYGDGRKQISVQWFAKIVELLRGACINIILLTTGLRNSDLTALEIGCCKPSGRVDILNYIEAHISKTGNHILIPVPNQARMAINVLERLRWNDKNKYVIAPSSLGTAISIAEGKAEPRVNGTTINNWLINFANHFGIHFVIAERDDAEYTAHCYRATVAGWLDAASNLSILLIKRLFGHTNSLMPLAYIHHNPIYIKARKDSLEKATELMSSRMAQAAVDHKLSGQRGEELIRGFEKHKVNCHATSESLSDRELFTTFQERIKERIMSGAMFAMMTPFGVICTRNPNDSTPTPCAKISDRDVLKESEVDKELWSYMQARPNPGQCIGKRCEHAMLGPWSTALKDSFSWYVDFLEGRIGQELSTNELIMEAKSFVAQYAPDMKKIFEMEVASARTE